jgi:hypothetical protein
LILRHLLIDWLTLRFPLGPKLGEALSDRVRGCVGKVMCFDADGVMKWEKKQLDLDKLRSDTMGLLWQVQSDGKRLYLVIGGSPASLEHGCNVFGSLDIRHSATVLVRSASRILRTVLPPVEAWQCRRVDVTGNYLLPDADSVKLALRMLVNTDAARRRAQSAKKGGDTVVWQPTSDLAKGKAYHKGPQLRYLAKLEKVKVSEAQLDAADRFMRLEHTRGARWFRRLEQQGRHWVQLTAWELWQLYRDFFGKLVEGVEVKDMGRDEWVYRIKEANGITQGRAEAAFTTFRNIRADGFDVVKGYMPERTFYLHLKHLRAAGIADADLHSGKVIPFRPVRVVLAQPVGSWAEVMRVA